ncbi:MAG: hypothetical protein JRL30_00950 [Deltaproteobacteria bacterium]|nr:hypothetical protein [Deltaproteobacteria bacterium]
MAMTKDSFKTGGVKRTGCTSPGSFSHDGAEVAETPPTPEDMIEVTELKRVRLEPGDTVVIITEKRLGQANSERIIDHLKDVFPNHEVLILEDGLRIGVMGPGPEDDPDEQKEGSGI